MQNGRIQATRNCFILLIICSNLTQDCFIGVKIEGRMQITLELLYFEITSVAFLNFVEVIHCACHESRFLSIFLSVYLDLWADCLNRYMYL